MSETASTESAFRPNCPLGGPIAARTSLNALAPGLALAVALGPWLPTQGELLLPASSTVLELTTDDTHAIHSARLPVQLPFGVGLAGLRFQLSFATRESVSPESFLDAFSVSYQAPGDPRFARLLTTDASGSYWFPNDPESLPLPQGFLSQSSLSPALPVAAPWPTSVTFAVALTLPLDWQNCESILWLDLFDNRDGIPSTARFDQVQLVAREPFFLLESSASPIGPFAAEMQAEHHRATSAFTLPFGGKARFFRLRADSAVHLRILGHDAEAWRLAYEFPEPNPRLEWAPRPEGPYSPAPGAVLDATQRRFSVAFAAGPPRFYRVLAQVQTTITRIERTRTQHTLHFEYRPRVFSLQSSAQPCGPYADDPSAVFDTASQRIHVSKQRLVRFFRIAHSDPARSIQLQPPQRIGDSWHLPYSQAPADAVPTEANFPSDEAP